MDIISQRNITLPEVKEIIKQRKKEKSEFGLEHEQTEAYVESFSKLTVAKAKAMMKQLEEMGIESQYASQIVDLLPRSVSVIKLIFEKASKKPTEKEVNAIMDLVKEYSK